jgi:hypothetical protein
MLYTPQKLALNEQKVNFTVLTTSPQGRYRYLLDRTAQPFTKINDLHEAVLEKLKTAQLVKKYTIFYGTQKFITVFPQAHH